MKLILASTSASRRAMLDAAGVRYEAYAPNVDERAVEADLRDATPTAIGATLAGMKALTVPADADVLVLGCDQILQTPDGRTQSKPADPAEARAQLSALRGRAHRLISSAAIAHAGAIVWRATEIATLHVRDFGDAFLDDYLAREWTEIRHTVGGYRIEAMGVQLFDRIEGSHFAVLGMPLLPILAYLREQGVMAS